MDRSLIWSWLGRISKHGLLPIPISAISVIRNSVWITFELRVLKKARTIKWIVYLYFLTLVSRECDWCLQPKSVWCLDLLLPSQSSRLASAFETIFQTWYLIRPFWLWNQCRMSSCYACRYKYPDSIIETSKVNLTAFHCQSYQIWYVLCVLDRVWPCWRGWDPQREKRV